MPPKRDGVINSREARTLLAEASTMKAAIISLQIEAGDRKDTPILRRLNRTDIARGYRQLSDEEWDMIRSIVRRLVDAAVKRREGSASAP